MKESAVSEKKTASAQRKAGASAPTRDEQWAVDRPLMSIVQRSCSGCVPSVQSMAGGMMQTPAAQRQAAAMSLQRTRGNRFVQKMAVQAKLVVGPADDKYEKEADLVADQVVDMISSSDRDTVQRMDDEDELDLEEKAKLQRKVADIRAAGSADAVPELESAIHRVRSGGQPLSEAIRQPMERAFGADFSGVRIHADGDATRLTRDLNALAFTHGQDVFFGAGQYGLNSRSGKQLLAHELAHVIQQTGRAPIRQTGEIAASELQVLRMKQPYQIVDSRVVQRRVALAKEQEGTADFVELTSIDYAIHQAGGPVELLKNSDFSQMNANKKTDNIIFIVGHGARGESGDYTADQIVNKLFTGSNRLQNPIQKIGFTSCYAGAGVKGDNEDTTTSVVAKIKLELKNKGWSNVEVTGARGPSIKSRALGKEFTVVPSQRQELELVGNLQKLLEKIYEPRKKTNDAISKREQEQGRTITLEEKAVIAKDVTSEFYLKFVRFIKDPAVAFKEVLALADKNKVKLTPGDMILLGDLGRSAKSLTLKPPMLNL